MGKRCPAHGLVGMPRPPRRLRGHSGRGIGSRSFVGPGDCGERHRLHGRTACADASPLRISSQMGVVGERHSGDDCIPTAGPSHGQTMPSPRVGGNASPAAACAGIVGEASAAGPLWAQGIAADTHDSPVRARHSQETGPRRRFAPGQRSLGEQIPAGNAAPLQGRCGRPCCQEYPLPQKPTQT